MSYYEKKNRSTYFRPFSDTSGRSGGWHHNRDFRDQNNVRSKPVIFQTKTQSEVNSQIKHLFEEFVNPDLIENRVIQNEVQQTNKIHKQNQRGIKLITVTPIYITALHLILQENQFFGIHEHRFCFYDFGVQEFIGTINRDRYADAAERVIPQLEKRAPWLFNEQDESHREDPVVLLTKPQDFNTAYILQNYLHPTFPRDLQEEFDECLRSTHPNKTNVIRFVERNKERLYSGITDPHFYHKVTSLILDATIVDSQNRLILSQIESSLVVRFLHHGGQKCFIADEFIFRKSFVGTTSHDVLSTLQNKMAQVKFNYGIFRQRKSTSDNKAVVGIKRGYNTDVVAVYEEYYTKLMEKLFPAKLDCITKMQQLIDADLRYSRFPGLMLYMVSHGLSMLEQKCFGRRLQSPQVHFEVPRQRDTSLASHRSRSSRRSQSSSRRRSSSRSRSTSRSGSSRSRSASRISFSPASRRGKDSRKELSPRRRDQDGINRVQPPTDQSPKRSTSPMKHQSPRNIVSEERTNRFDRALLSEQVDRNSPLQSRSNSLVITDITYVDNQAARLESELAGIPHHNTNQVGQKRQRESSNESAEVNNAKKRKTEINDAVDMGNGPGAQEQQNVEPTLSQEMCASANDELLELLASWQ